MLNPSPSPPPQTSRFSPTFANSMPVPVQSPSIIQHHQQRQPSYGTSQSVSPVSDYAARQQVQESSVPHHHQRQPSYGASQSVSPVPDYVSRQQLQEPSPTTNVPSTSGIRRPRLPSEAQTIYSSAMQAQVSHTETNQSPTYTTTATTRSTVDGQDLDYFTTSFGQNPNLSLSQNSPTANVPSSSGMRRPRPPSEAQSIYSSAMLAQTMPSPTDTSQSPIYTTRSTVDGQDADFDALSLYSSPLSAPSTSMPSPNFQPQRRHAASVDSSNFYITTSANQATSHLRATHTMPVPQRPQGPNVLRRKPKPSSSFFATLGSNSKPNKPNNTPKPNDVPIYVLVAQAPLESSTKPVTPAFQSTLYSKPPLIQESTTLSTNSNQNSTALQQMTQGQGQTYTQTTTSNQASLGTTSISNIPAQGLLNAPSVPNNTNVTQPSMGAMNAGSLPAGSATIPQLVPLRTQSTVGAVSAGSVPTAPVTVPVIRSLASPTGMVNPTPSMMSQTAGVSSASATLPTVSSINNVVPSMYSHLPASPNGMVNPTPSMMNQGTSLMFPQSQVSNGRGTATSLPYDQSLLSMPQLGSLPPTRMTGPLSVSPGLMGQPQLNNGFPNGMLPPSMGQAPMAMGGPQQPIMFPNGYMGGPFGAPVTQMQGGFPVQTPGVMVANNTPQQGKENDKNNELMKKVGMSVGKAVLKFGTKYALEQMGVDDSELIGFFFLCEMQTVETGFSCCRCSRKFDCFWGGTCCECGDFEKVGCASQHDV